ncbi:MAG TPA: SAV_915 family protein [Pseudonocardiaceae bacterium]|nr:SAV_915 family protein [Pseudonocardiaceae bacterium]
MNHLVYVPAHPGNRGGRQNVVFEVRGLPDGRRMLPVFTSTERLVAALGPLQPWAQLPLARASELMGEAGVDLVVVDPTADDDATRWQQGDIEALLRSQE